MLLSFLYLLNMVNQSEIYGNVYALTLFFSINVFQQEGTLQCTFCFIPCKETGEIFNMFVEKRGQQWQESSQKHFFSL